MQRFEYRVVQLRESLVGGKLSADKLEEILNDEARKGWMVKAITSAEVKGRVGPRRCGRPPGHVRAPGGLTDAQSAPALDLIAEL